jgi:hypothetical protein
MEPGVWPGLADAPAAPVVGGVIVRRESFECLDNAGRVTEVSAPAGSGKTVLLRSWIGQPGLVGRAAWVPVPDGGYDPQRFWTAVALRGTAAVSTLVRSLTPAPDLDGWAIVERLLKDLRPRAHRTPSKLTAPRGQGRPRPTSRPASEFAHGRDRPRPAPGARLVARRLSRSTCGDRGASGAGAAASWPRPRWRPRGRGPLSPGCPTTLARASPSRRADGRRCCFRP